MRSPPQGDEGFTLIEAVIAILVMAIAVVTMVGFLTTMITLSQNHRGHAAAETAARSFGQAVQATAQSPASLASAVNATETTITVTDATTLPGSGYLVLDREIVLLDVGGVNRATGVLTVARARGGTTASPHTTAAKVYPLLRCPSAADLTPHVSSFRTSTGVNPTITAVEYMDPATGQFKSTALNSSPPSSTDCEEDYHDVLTCPGTTVLPECGTGYYRVSISVSTTGDSRLNQVAATTQVLVRNGSA